MTGNEISINNHEVHGFSNSFQYKLKNPANWLAKYIFAYNLRIRFCRHQVFGRITKATMIHHLPPKNADIDGPIFFQNPYCWFISEHSLASLTKPNNPLKIYWRFVISDHYEHARHAWPHSRKTSCSNCSFHEYLITYKKQTFYLK